MMPFVLLWAGTSLALATAGFGWASLMLGFAPLGMIGLWVERPAPRRPLFTLLILAGASAALAAYATGAGWLIPLYALAAPGAIWFLRMAWFARSEQRHHDRALERATTAGPVFFLPDTGPEATAFRQGFEVALADPMAAAELAREVPDGWLLPPPGPDMDNGIEALADQIAGTDAALAYRLYRIAEHGTAIEFGHVTAGAAGLATAARQRRLREKIIALPH